MEELKARIVAEILVEHLGLGSLELKLVVLSLVRWRKGALSVWSTNRLWRARVPSPFRRAMCPA